MLKVIVTVHEQAVIGCCEDYLLNMAVGETINLQKLIQFINKSLEKNHRMVVYGGSPEDYLEVLGKCFFGDRPRLVMRKSSDNDLFSTLPIKAPVRMISKHSEFEWGARSPGIAFRKIRKVANLERNDYS